MKFAAHALAGLLSVAAAHAGDAPRMPAAPAPLPASVDTKSAPPSPRHLQGPSGHVCFSAAETREKIVQNRLTEPFRAFRAGRLQGEALRAKLCRFKQDDFVYEVSVLRRDGRIVRFYMNAQNGQAVAAPGDADHN